MAGDVVVLGFEALDRKLTRLAAIVEPQTFVQATYEGGLAFEAEVKRHIRDQGLIDQGNYRGSVTTEKTAQNQVFVFTTTIYARVHEFGATIVPRNKTILRFFIGDQEIFAKSVTIPARPHWRPAMDTGKDKVISAIALATEKLLRDAAG